MRDLSSILRALLRQREAMTYTPQADPKFEQPVTRHATPSAEDIKEALGYSRNDPNVQVRVIPAPGLSQRLSSGQGLNVEEFLRSLDAIAVTAGGNEALDQRVLGATAHLKEVNNVVEANIPHAGDDPSPEETEAQIKEAEGAERYAAGDGYAQNIANEVLEELGRAVRAHGSMQSAHEGYAVILEELDELWERVKTKGCGYDAATRKEAIQVAAMAMRFVLDLDPGEENTDESFGNDKPGEDD